MSDSLVTGTLNVYGKPTKSAPLGRQVLYTDMLPEDLNDIEKVKFDVSRILQVHLKNMIDIDFLQKYHQGYHPEIANRLKTTRVDVDNRITVNYPFSATRDITGYYLGKPIQYAHVAGTNGNKIETLNRVMMAENKALVDMEIANDDSICGTAFRGQFYEETPVNGTHLQLLRMDPLTTFVVYASNPQLGAMYAVSFYSTQPYNEDNNVYTYFTIYTPTHKWILKADGAMAVPNGMFVATVEGAEVIEDKPANFGGGLPIVEYPNNMWRLGDWEPVISLIDALDITASDAVNEIQQAVNSVLTVIGAEMTDEVMTALSAHGFLNIIPSDKDQKIEVKYITDTMDSTIGSTVRDYLEATMRVIVGIPDRKSRGGGGGDTGDAVFVRDGWQDIDLVAAAKEPYFIRAERTSLQTILYILETSDELSGLKATDIDIHFNRNKTANLQSKAQVLQILLGVGLDPLDAISISEMWANPYDVCNRYLAEKKKNDTKAQQIAEQAQQAAQPGAQVQPQQPPIGTAGTSKPVA